MQPPVERRRTPIGKGTLWAKEPRQRCLVIFVHGVFGHPLKTWGEFPRFLQESGQLHYCDFASYGYRTAIYSKAGLEKHADLLISWIKAHLDDYRHIFILAHSLGGLITSRALLSIRNNADLRKRVRVLFLFGVPYSGSWITNIVRRFLPGKISPLADALANRNSIGAELLRGLISTSAPAAAGPLPRLTFVYGSRDFVITPDDKQEVEKNIACSVYLVPETHQSLVKPKEASATSIGLVEKELKPYAYRAPIMEYLARGITAVNQLLQGPQVQRTIKVRPHSGPSDIYDTRDLDQTVALMESESAPFLVLLGGYGTGKTVYCQSLARLMAERAIGSFLSTPVPLFMSLRFLSPSESLIEGLARYVERYSVNLSAKLINQLINDGEVRLCIILDGFDEFANRTSLDTVKKFIKQLIEINESRTVSILISSRTTFFRTQGESKILPATHEGLLDDFAPNDVDAYIAQIDRQEGVGVDGSDSDRLAASARLKETVAAILRNNSSLAELCALPLHLRMLVEYLRHGGSEERLAASSGDPTKATNFAATELYVSFIDKAVQHAFLKYERSAQLDWLRAELAEIAYRWFVKRIFEWSVEDFEAFFVERGADQETIEGSARVMVDSGLFERVRDKYRFIHFSVLEHLVAERLEVAAFQSEVGYWEAGLYREIFERVAQLIARDGGFGNIPLAAIMGDSRPYVRANFLAMAYRHRVATMEPYIREALKSDNSPLVRCVAAQGFGLYDATTDRAEFLATVTAPERNSIVRAVLVLTARRWIGERGMHDAGSASPKCPVALDAADAKAIVGDGDLVLRAYRQALSQGDRMWTSTVGAILILGLLPDVESRAEIDAIAGASQNPEIVTAYTWVNAALAGGPAVQRPGG